MKPALQSPDDLTKAFIGECLRSRLTNGDLTTASALAEQPGFDWDYLLLAADDELVSPLLHDILAGQAIVPAYVEEMLARKYAYIVRRNLFLLHELSQILVLFRGAGVEAIVLKGAALTETVYKNIALRPMRDLDLLIRREQWAAALTLMAQAGFRQTAFIERESYPAVLEKSGIEPVTLELHRSLFHSLHYQQNLALDWFWETATCAPSSTEPMKVLGLEAQILHLCGHLALHHIHQPSLLWSNDLAELIFTNKDKIQWDIFIDKAQTLQLILPSQKILVPIARDWGAPVPQEVLEQLQSLPVTEAERRAFALSTAVKQSEGEGYWMRLQEITGWHRRLAYVLKWLFPAPDALRSRYKISRSWLLPLAYPYHWWMGARLVIEALLTKQKGDEGQGVGNDID